MCVTVLYLGAAGHGGRWPVRLVQSPGDLLREVLEVETPYVVISAVPLSGADVDRLLSALRHFDVVVGVPSGSAPRLLTSAFFNAVAGTRLRYIHTGVYAARTALVKMAVARVSNPLTDVVPRLAEWGYSVVEVELEAQARPPPGWLTAPLRTLAGSTSALLFTIGVLLAAVDVAAAGWLAYEAVRFGVFHWVAALVAVYMLTLGAAFILTSAARRAGARPRRRPNPDCGLPRVEFRQPPTPRLAAVDLAGRALVALFAVLAAPAGVYLLQKNYAAAYALGRVAYYVLAAGLLLLLIYGLYEEMRRRGEGREKGGVSQGQAASTV